MKKILIPLMILAFGRVVAQTPTCTGGLGDPIVDITFGSGAATYGGPLAQGITNMAYIADACPNDGYYSIVHSTSGCFGGTWLNVTSDHTGNPNGYFMLINASYQPSDFYVQTINGLCAGTTYQFAAWILNMVDVQGLILPNITFNIESVSGTVLGTYSTGNIPASVAVDWVHVMRDGWDDSDRGDPTTARGIVASAVSCALAGQPTRAHQLATQVPHCERVITALSARLPQRFLLLNRSNHP